ncbi:hypothetical protein HNV08_08935 [Winogradskyella eckloniae]|uniref:hypothetical protein n=1 Tax=Winogradskyella eckloniae TaxID=1089306 RepID=UPI0015646283|nr:hypothetical protein [Winogradskyella eckloniae]NRD20173.1 hypothetical protein [Winogradskyella eckloniae]
MRTDNRSVKSTIISIYFILLVLAILLATVFKSYDVFKGSSLYIVIGLVVAVVIVHFVASYFEYDSDGTKLVITNQGLILTDYVNYRERKIEIAKDRIVGYKINNFKVYKTLVVSKKNKDGSVSQVRFNITLLKNKKIKYVKQSLRKIIKENKSKLG